MDIKDFFKDDQGKFDEKEFKEAVLDTSFFKKLKIPTKYIIELEDLEKEIRKIMKVEKNFRHAVLLANYKRYLYKHILEIEKGQ